MKNLKRTNHQVTAPMWVIKIQKITPIRTMQTRRMKQTMLQSHLHHELDPDQKKVLNECSFRIFIYCSQFLNVCGRLVLNSQHEDFYGRLPLNIYSIDTIYAITILHPKSPLEYFCRRFLLHTCIEYFPLISY